MANVLSLAMKISADATGVRQSLSPVERALQQLDKEAASVTAVFRKFGSESAAAAQQQEKFEVRLRALTESLKAGLTSPQDYARSLEQLQAAANDAADDLGRAAQIVEANLTKEQRATKAYEQSIAELNRLRDAGLLDEEQYGLAVQRSAESFAKATVEANKYATASNAAGDGGALKFNELSGVLSALPGPIGNVAGRLSGLSSAGEGLSRVFGAGLSQGLTSIGASVAGLVNPFTAAVAGVAAFGAAATAVVQGLTSLEDRVENLGNTADKLGVSFEFIQTLEAAATRSGTSIDAVSAAFGRLQKSVLGVDEESKSAQKALAEIGVTSEELAALSPEEQYLRIGQSLAAIEDPARRTATSIALFGKSGADLLPFFRNLPGAAVDMERFGRALTVIDRRRIDEFGAGLDALGVATQGLGQSLLLPFVGLGEGVATAFAEITAGLTAIIDPIGQVLEPILTNIGRVIELIGTGIGNLGRVIGAVFEPFATVVQAVSQAFEPLAESVFGFLESISNAAVAVTEWVVSFTPIGAIAANVGVLGDTISRVVTIITTAFGRIGEVIGNTLGSVAEYVGSTVASFTEFTGLSGALSAIGGVINSVFGSVASVFSTIAGAIGGTVGRLLTMAENFLGIDRAASDAAKGVDATAASVTTLTAEQQKAMTEVQKAIADSGKALDGAIEKAGEFGQAGFDAALEFQTALEDLQEQANSGELNAEQYARGVANATAEYDRQIESLRTVQEETRKAADEAQRRVDADKQVADQLLEQARINREFGGDTNRAQAAEQVLAVEREIARIREEVAAAIDNGDAEAVANGEERIRQLGVIKSEQESIADGSAAAAEAERQRLDDQRARVDELLAAGQEQSEIERQIIDVQEQQAQATADLLTAREASNQAEADAAAARLAQLDQLQARLEDQQQASEQGFGEGFARAFKQVDQAIGQTINKAAEFGNAGAEAAQRLQEGIAAAQEQARDGILNKEAFDAEVARQQELFAQEIQNLEDIKKKKAQDAADEVKNAEAQRAALAKQAADAATAQEREQTQFAQAQQKQYEEAQKAQQDFAAEQAKAQAAEFDRQQKRLGELNTVGSQTVNTADVRTQEGAALVLGLAANAQDPRLIEARLTNKLLRQQANALLNNLNRIGVPSVILG
jgi:phage-related protein